MHLGTAVAGSSIVSPRFRGLALLAALTVAGCSPIDSADPAAARNSSDSSLSGSTPRLGIGDPLPDIALRNANGTPFDLEALEGSVVVLTFFESRSPDPTLCPELIRRFAALQDTLLPEISEHVQLLTISVDPAYDTEPVLRSAAAAAGAESARWVFARPATDSVEPVAAAFGVLLWGRGDGSIGHTLNTVVIDRAGRLVDQFPGVDDWSMMDLLAATTAATETR